MVRFVSWFKELTKKDIAIAGGKGASLAEMYRANFPVPPGFVVTAQAYQYFVESTKIGEKIFSMLEHLNVEDNSVLQDTSEKIQDLILAQEMPVEIKNDIIKAYQNMVVDTDVFKTANKEALQFIKAGRDVPFVAVRSSATAEDLPEASFAGQQATFVNVKGNEKVISAVQQCWASLFTARAIYYRTKNNFPHEKVFIAVVVQKMIASEKSGVAFSVNPANGNENEITIEAGFGLGDAIVSGAITPDTYIVDKANLYIKNKRIGGQEFMFVRDEYYGRTIKKKLSPNRANEQKLTEDEVSKLGGLVKKIEKHYGKPQDIEFAIEHSRIYIVQSRPITTLKKVDVSHDDEKIEGEELLSGLGASPGIGFGKVKILKDMHELDKVQKGDVLVAEMTNPDFVPAMERASAIVTDEGGMTSHASIVSRELGIPCVVGTDKATKILKEDQEVTVDGYNGKVYGGKVEVQHEEEKVEELSQGELLTATKIYMNLGVPDKIDEYKSLPFDGIGLMRIEFIIASEVKQHPLYLIEIGQEQVYVDKLVEGIEKVAKAISPKPVIVRFSDFKTNEYRDLEGGEKFEPKEDNPMIGWRGVSRYVSEEFEKAFRLECKAIKKVREDCKNVHVMLPFVRNTNEVEKCLDILKNEGLERKEGFKIALMAEVPSIIFLADKFCQYCDIFSIGSNDLTQLILGVDRDSSILGKMGYFDERNLAVKRAIKHLITVAHKNNVKVSICGQAPSEYPEFVEFLVKIGVDSMSVNHDVVSQVRRQVAIVERKILLEKESEKSEMEF